jgi:hypothetical protein
MRRLFTIVLGVVLAICIFCKLENAPLFMENEFQQYYKDFMKDAALLGVTPDFSLSLTYLSDDVDEGVGGYCLGKKYVVISQQTWDYLDEDGKKAILYHEWGHCILQRAHSTRVIEALNCPASVMYPTIDPLENCFGYLKPWYILELFTNPWNDPLLYKK